MQESQHLQSLIESLSLAGDDQLLHQEESRLPEYKLPHVHLSAISRSYNHIDGVIFGQ